MYVLEIEVVEPVVLARYMYFYFSMKLYFL